MSLLPGHTVVVHIDFLTLLLQTLNIFLTAAVSNILKFIMFIPILGGVVKEGHPYKSLTFKIILIEDKAIKKVLTFLYSKLLYKISQDFLDIQYYLVKN